MGNKVLILCTQIFEKSTDVILKVKTEAKFQVQLSQVPKTLGEICSPIFSWGNYLSNFQ